jgi:hypothetical protein
MAGIARRAWFALVLSLFAAGTAHAQFGGAWDTTYGRMELRQIEDQVYGVYEYGPHSTIEGTVEDGRLTFRYVEPSAEGEGWFQISPDGSSFSGEWREDGSVTWAPWQGARILEDSFTGAWQTTFGRMELRQAGDIVQGVYEYGANSTLVGTVADGRLTFRYTEPQATGEGWFELSPDGATFTGEWREDGSVSWAPWTGGRVVAAPGRSSRAE